MSMERPNDDDLRHPFWNEDCPGRGPALHHTHDRACEEHPYQMCCYCGGSPTLLLLMRRQQTMPPIDMAARLRMLGLDPSHISEEAEGILPPEMQEPKLATGQYSTHPKSMSEPGRGPLSLRQKARLGFVKWRTKDWEDQEH